MREKEHELKDEVAEQAKEGSKRINFYSIFILF